MPKCPKCKQKMSIDSSRVKTAGIIAKLCLMHNPENKKVAYCDWMDLEIWIPIDLAWKPLSEEYISSAFKTAYDNQTFKADEIDRYVMKKTTQESPEWTGRTNQVNHRVFRGWGVE